MTEFHTAKPRQRNREVPFPNPDELYKGGELEQLFLTDNETLPLQAELPETFTSIAFDMYASWLSDLTQADPKKLERGAYGFLNANTGAWTFPQNPNIGNEHSVVRLLTRKPSVHFPVVSFHSHPDSTAPSGADMTLMMSDTGFFFEGDNDAVMEIVGAKGFNYLVLRTDDSKFESSERIDAMKKEYQQVVNNSVIHLAEFVRNLGRESGLSDESVVKAYERIREKELEAFGADYPRYFSTLNVINAIAQLQRFGFYRSGRDGIFKKVSNDDLPPIRDQEVKIIQEEISKMVENG